MKETRDIIRAFERAKRHEETCILASVVRVRGSTYRRPGARALFMAGGEIIGLIGGGCLETDLLLQAEKVRDTGQPHLIGYDSTSNDDIVWGLGLGCNGRVDVLLEAVGAENSGPLDFIARCLNERIPGLLATVIQCENPLRLASRYMLETDGKAWQSANWDTSLDLSVHADEIAASPKPRVIASDSMEILVEAIDPPLRLVVAGAGPDAVPLVAIAASLGWCVEVFDHRETFARRERFPGANSVSVTPVAEIARTARTDRRTAVVIMTHHFLNDRELLQGFLESKVAYCGVLGPKTRLERLLDSLTHDGCVPQPEPLRKLKGPVGLDLGAETPEEIALSIVAEIQACFAGCDGTPLTRKAGPIHV
ncbi:MAG: XdhC family protein [Methylococcales bacterium]